MTEYEMKQLLIFCGRMLPKMENKQKISQIMKLLNDSLSNKEELRPEYILDLLVPSPGQTE